MYHMGIWNPKKLREKFIKPTVMIIRKYKQAEYVYQKNDPGKKNVSINI